jgi:FKBP-type peptidyl-prolyl cis-trans isomerase SlyD
METANGRVVTINYSLTLDDGTTLGQEHGVEYLQGFYNILPGLEQGIAGAGPGDRRTVVLEPPDAYGEYDPERLITAPIDDVPDGSALEPGMWITARTAKGPVELKVTEVKDDSVVFDANHPLAGQRLHFEVEITAVRSAAEYELEQGRPGPKACKSYG